MSVIPGLASSSEAHLSGRILIDKKFTVAPESNSDDSPHTLLSFVGENVAIEAGLFQNG